MKNLDNAAPVRESLRIGLLAALLAGVMLTSFSARADSRGDAKRHFRDGMSLIAAGQVERGIAELKQAYAIKPHPDVLYDIAKAYVDLGDVPEALNYFKQYVATDPEDKEQVLKVMQRLSSIAQPAAGAAPGAQPAAPQNIDTQKLLAQLQALINQQSAAAPPAAGARPAAPPTATAPAEADMFEAATVTADTRATAKEIAEELSGARDTAGEELFDEQVVTAGVRASSENRAPASLTVITDDEIRMSGAATVPEILRRVPGIDVAEMNPSDTNISIRGFNRRVSNTVLVLVDGRSVYQESLGTTLWPLLDVSVQDISRIEIIRGPASALYGANAFAGVVNIITKIGDDAGGARAFVQAGNHSTVEGGVSAGGRAGKLSYRTTVAYDRADKWTKDVTGGGTDPNSQFNDPNRSREVQRADLAANYDLGGTQVQAGGGFDNFGLQAFPLGLLPSFGNEGQSGFARLGVDNGQSKLKISWNELRMKSGPEFGTVGVRSLRDTVRSDVIDVSAQSGVDFRGLGTHHLNIGAGYRFKSLNWGYLAAQVDGGHRYDEHHLDAFLQEEWQPSRKWSVVLLYRVDREPLLVQQETTPGGLVHSPRGSLLYEFKPDQVLRLTVGSAFRAPTFLESYIDLFTPASTQPAGGVHFLGSRDLQPEQMLQAELGYRGRWGRTLQPDLVVYGERVQNLITDGAPRSPGGLDPATGRPAIGLGFENQRGSFFGLGTEVGGKWSPAEGFDVIANYAFEKMYGCNTDPRSQGCTDSFQAPSQASAVLGETAQHKVNVTAMWRTRANLDFGMDLHYVSGVTWFEKSLATGGAAGVLFNPSAIPAYTLLNGRVGYRWIKDKLDTGVAVYNLLGDDHREHPSGAAIGRRVLFTATGSF